MPDPIKINSNDVGLFYAEETTPKVLPGSPKWYGLDPNDYSDFGGNLRTVARNPINRNRQRKKGTVVGLDAAGGITQDLTQKNLIRLQQGFFFANVRQKPTNYPVNGAQNPMTSVSGTQYLAATGLAAFLPGHIVFGSGFGVAGNNGLHIATAAAAGTVTAAGLTAEASPPAAAKIEAVGVQFASGDATLTVTAGAVTLGTTVFNLTTLGLVVGEWVWIGGDTAGTQFINAVNKGYARIASIAASAIAFNETTFVAVNDAGTAKTVQMFFGIVTKNERDALIIERSYALEQSLGSDAVGVQSQVLQGAYANEYTLNLPKEDKVTVELAFVALNNITRDGTAGLLSDAGGATKEAASNETCFNTSLDIYRSRLAAAPTAGVINAASLFAYVSEASLVINNNVTPNTALGVLGGFSVNVGSFDISGDLTVYFATVAAIAAIRANTDLEFNVILARANAGMIYDVPLLGASGGIPNIQANTAVMLPIETAAGENTAGYTLLTVNFPYLPTVAMPV